MDTIYNEMRCHNGLIGFSYASFILLFLEPQKDLLLFHRVVERLCLRCWLVEVISITILNWRRRWRGRRLGGRLW